MKKQLLIGVMAGVMALSTTAFASDAEVWDVGFSIRELGDNFFTAFVNKLEELCDADDTINLTVAGAEGDSQKQLDQLDNFMIKEMDCIVLTPQDGSSVVEHVENFNAEGIPVICWTQKADGGEFTYVGCSDYETGLLEGQWCYEHLPEGAKVLYLGGDLGFQTSIDRRQAFVDGLGDRIKADWDGNELNADGDVEVLSWQTTMYTLEEGQNIMEDWIQTFDDFQAVVGCNDSVILGAREALLGAGIEDVMLVGIDALDDTLAGIKEGTISATVRQSAVDQAVAVYDAIKVLQEGGENPAEIFPELTLIDASNVDEFLG